MTRIWETAIRGLARSLDTIAPRVLQAHESEMTRRSPLDDPHNAAFAWARYWRVMRLMGLITLLTVIIALVAIFRQTGWVSPHYFIAAAIGISFSMLLMSGLMGLMFLSSGTGHDEAVDQLSEDEPDQPSG